ncbi:MAG: hypothetical protein LN414_01925, partial [Candidatus Thermoplasmatota archaeon]|nr:hypothetical protein [Candidatus Thermoplasmatota archaeon]
FETTVFSEVVNSNLTMRGWFIVNGPGVLNITSSNIVFLGKNASDSNITAMPGSILRLLDGTVIEGSGQPFYIVSEGNLLARNSTIIGGGEVGGAAALCVNGVAGVVSNVTFRDCGLALAVGGRDTTVRNSAFIMNRQSVLLNGALRLSIIDCSFSLSNTSWDIQGNFTYALRITGCDFEGGGRVNMSMLLVSPKEEDATLVMTNVTISNYNLWGLQDEHFGSTTMTGCVLVNANITLGQWANDGVTINGLRSDHSDVELGSAGFTLADCVFINASFRVHANSGGSLLTRCRFTGSYANGAAALEVDGSIHLTLRDLDLTDVDVGIRVSGGSEISVSGLILYNATGTAVEVNGSIVRLEACRLRGLKGSGVKVWNVGSRLEFRNGTIMAEVGRIGHDVDASNGGDAWLLNTTFDRTSVISTGAGRVEVLWHLTVEPVLPWGGVLMDPDFLSVGDAIGIEVVNISNADDVLHLFEFGEEDGVRTLRTPHLFNVSDIQVGVRYSGAHIIDASRHLVIDLLDVASPVARAGPDQVENEDQVVTLNASYSSDNDPTFQLTGSFRWSFDEYGNQVVLNGALVKYGFSVPGKFWVNLTVWDTAGNVGTDTVIIQVRDRTPPVIWFDGNVTVDEDDWYIFDASATTDNDPFFDFTTGTFLWSIDLGTDVLERDTATFGHAFPDPGNYSGSISVFDKAGNMAREDLWIYVLDIS